MDNEKLLIQDLCNFIDLLTEKIEKELQDPGKILTEEIGLKGMALMVRAGNFLGND